MYKPLTYNTHSDPDDLSPLWFAGIYTQNTGSQALTVTPLHAASNCPLSLQGQVFFPEVSPYLDPDTIALPGNILNTLEEFELDYSQVSM